MPSAAPPQCAIGGVEQGIHCYIRRRAYGPAIAGSEPSDIDD
jgi:hypothetical protein